MKKVILIAGVTLAALFMSSCASTKSPVTGFVYMDVKAPEAVTANGNSSKVGTAKVQSILGIVATGDASIEAAATSAGISKIHHIDYVAKNILGIVASYTIYVYGE
ncbi:MAG: TRL-like family protein [Rikenellaceae bacterium]|nr:TRL-like family protein [Rikenellaceae bacterium]